MLESSKFEMTNSKYAMVTICNVLMNITVLEPGFVEECPIFFHLLKFIMTSLPTLQNSGTYSWFLCTIFWVFTYCKMFSLCLDEQLVLYGNLSVLGLLILKHHPRKPKSTEFSVYKFVQSIIRFLWDAHNNDEAEEDDYGVSNTYLAYWNELIDLWYLGMQVLSSLLPQVCNASIGL